MAVQALLARWLRLGQSSAAEIEGLMLGIGRKVHHHAWNMTRVADLHDLEWLLNHSNANDTWAPRPDIQYLGVGQYNLPARPRNRPLYVHPYRQPSHGNNRAPPMPISLSPPRRFRHRNQPKHPLSYNPICPRHPYQYGGARMVPNPTTVSRGPRRSCAHTPEHPRVNYPADLIPYLPYRHNDDWYMQPPTVRDLAYIAQIAAALPSRYCLLTLQQALWITHHLEANVWPGLLWSQTTDEHIQDAAMHEACYWIDNLHGGYAYIIENDN
jgi:hypothetical protein